MEKDPQDLVCLCVHLCVYVYNIIRYYVICTYNAIKYKYIN